MEKAFEFLKTNKEVAFATAEDGKPKIRVFQIMRQEKNILYFVTAPGKEVYRQLQKNPNIEVLAMRGNISVRIAGQTVFDVDDKTAREIYAANPVLPRLYRAYTDGATNDDAHLAECPSAVPGGRRFSESAGYGAATAIGR